MCNLHLVGQGKKKTLFLKVCIINVTYDDEINKTQIFVVLLGNGTHTKKTLLLKIILMLPQVQTYKLFLVICQLLLKGQQIFANDTMTRYSTILR